VAALYGLDTFYQHGLHGQGETIAFLEFTLPNQRDDAAFWAKYSLQPQLNRPATARILPAGKSTPADLGETDLDLQYAGALAPGSRLAAYVLDGEATLGDFMCAVRRALRAVVADGIRIVSVSLGAGDLAAAEVGEIQDPVTGESWPDAATFASELDAWITSQQLLCFVAAGDSVVYAGFPSGDGRVQASWPATQGAVIAVGGTQLADAPDITSGEQAWGGQTLDAGLLGYNPSNTLPQASGGGGASSFILAPARQASLGATMRLTPDVAAFAGPLTIVDRGVETPVWGTSAAAPIAAAIAALYHQATRRSLDHQVLAQTARDILDGNNLNSALLDAGLGEFAEAGPGFDLCTGAGVPDVAGLPGAG
jgi:subtilase family serine protease